MNKILSKKASNHKVLCNFHLLTVQIAIYGLCASFASVFVQLYKQGLVTAETEVPPYVLRMIERYFDVDRGYKLLGCVFLFGLLFFLAKKLKAQRGQHAAQKRLIKAFNSLLIFCTSMIGLAITLRIASFDIPFVYISTSDFVNATVMGMLVTHIAVAIVKIETKV